MFQCDEGKPRCERCIKSKRLCLESRAVEQATFSIHDENQYASGETKRPRGPRSNLTYWRPQVDLQTRALSYYLRCHLQTTTDRPNLWESLSGCVTEWTNSGKSCWMVDLALSTLALATWSRIHQDQAGALQAASKYSQLLKMMQEEVSRVESHAVNERNIDGCLLAVLLMGRYESVTYEPGDSSERMTFGQMQSWSHQDGAMAILKARNDNPAHVPATFITKYARRALTHSSLLRNRPLPDWMLDGRHLGEHNLELDFDRIFIQTVNVHYMSTVFARQDDLDIDIGELDNCRKEAQGLDCELRRWATHLPSTWSYEQREIPLIEEMLPKHFYASTVHAYPQLNCSAIWCEFFAAEMLINSIQMRVLRLIQRHTDPNQALKKQWQVNENELNTMADNLASTIPFCLERFKVVDSSNPLTGEGSVALNTEEEVKPYLANLVVWPLTIASSLESVDVVQQHWFRAELAELGRVTGNGILECAETPQWGVL